MGPRDRLGLNHLELFAECLPLGLRRCGVIDINKLPGVGEGRRDKLNQRPLPGSQNLHTARRALLRLPSLRGIQPWGRPILDIRRNADFRQVSKSAQF